MKISKEKLLELFETMVLIRQFERKVYEFATTGVVKGSVHLCIGEEAAAAGTVMSMGKDDYLLPVFAREESVLCIFLIKTTIILEHREY